MHQAGLHALMLKQHISFLILSGSIACFCLKRSHFVFYAYLDIRKKHQPCPVQSVGLRWRRLLSEF